jgi:DNA-binding GntR family transcriptional regulator
MAAIERGLPLQEQTYQALRVAILSGELAPGERLIETQLAQRLQVSRTPIREAIRQLQHSNLATIDDSGTLRVATFSKTDAIHLYDCRIALEHLSVTGACEQITALQLTELEAFVTQAEKMMQNPFSQLTNFQLLDLDYRFHRLLAKSSGNLWLMSLLDQVFDQMALLRIQTMQQNPEVLDVCSEHRRIYQAVADRETNTAIQAIQTHLMASKERVVQEVQHASSLSVFMEGMKD